MTDRQKQTRGEEAPEPGRLTQETRDKIGKLRGRANRGVWAMALFLAVSLGAMRGFDFVPSLPANVRQMLGAPPPVTLISAALVVYSFSAIILTLSRMTLTSGKYGGITHVGYLGAFYGFYHYATALDDNFWAVLAAGVTVLTLESYHIWTYYRGLIREEEEKLTRLEARLKRTTGA
jgi:O-antigen/teichoic acid export membrane protein